jgi:hypothetical protein
MEMDQSFRSEPGQPIPDNPFDSDEAPYLVTINLFGDSFAHDQWVHDLLLAAVRTTGRVPSACG